MKKDFQKAKLKVGKSQPAQKIQVKTAVIHVPTQYTPDKDSLKNHKNQSIHDLLLQLKHYNLNHRKGFLFF